MIIDLESSSFALGEKSVEMAEILSETGRNLERTLDRVGFERLFRTALPDMDFFRTFLSDKLELGKRETLVLVNQSAGALIPGLGPKLLSNISLPDDLNLIEISDGCTGFLRALNIANLILESESSAAVTIVCGEVYSPFIESSSSSAPIFSDSISLVRLLPGKGFRVQNYVVKNDFQRHQSISIQEESSRAEFLMEGPAVLGWVMNNVREVGRQLLRDDSGVRIDPDLWFIHQGSKIVVETVEKALALTSQQAFWSASYGNTSSSSIPIGMKLLEDQVHSSQRIGLISFGIGLTMIGAVLEAEP